MRSEEQGSESDGKTPRPGAGECWVCPVSKCRDSTTHPQRSSEDSGISRSPKEERCSRIGVAASATSRTVGIGRLAAGATVGSGFGDITRWGWCRRRERIRLRAEGSSSETPKVKLPGEARAPLGESPVRLTTGAVRAKESRHGGRRTCGVFPPLARTENRCGSEPQGANT